MRFVGALIFAGAIITSISSMLNYSSADAQTSSTAANGARHLIQSNGRGQKLRLEYSFESCR